MRRPRHLSPEERALWDRVKGTTTPMDPETRPDPTPLPPVRKKPVAPRDPLPDFQVGQRANAHRPNDLLPGITHRLVNAPVHMDSKSFGKMKRGKLVPEGRIDLHGMTMAEAHPELLSFILGSQAMGRRLVLVITGKGKDRDDGGPIPTRNGILRHQVPQWLALPPLAQAVLQVTPAHLKHGGHGAYYVYLRRRR
ncbi:Smr/MutS family protein [Yoonia sp.]|uniref:Smr/MutS family protein n=1 Tax=Yoonia sp. TaxID=2212373 RepID=UPI003A4E27A9